MLRKFLKPLSTSALPSCRPARCEPWSNETGSPRPLESQELNPSSPVLSFFCVSPFQSLFVFLRPVFVSTVLLPYRAIYLYVSRNPFQQYLYPSQNVTTCTVAERSHVQKLRDAVAQIVLADIRRRKRRRRGKGRSGGRRRKRRRNNRGRRRRRGRRKRRRRRRRKGRRRRRRRRRRK